MADKKVSVYHVGKFLPLRSLDKDRGVFCGGKYPNRDNLDSNISVGRVCKLNCPDRLGKNIGIFHVHKNIFFFLFTF